MLISMNIGNQTIPDIRLPSLIGEVKRIYEKLGEDEQSDEVVSSALEYKSSKSGTWLRKRAALRFYDLIELKNGKIQITKLGKTVAYPEDEAKYNEAITQMINKVPLWVELSKKYDAYNNKPTVEKLWPDMVKFCSIPPEQAKSVSSLVAQYFMEDIGMIKYGSIIPKQENMQTENVIQNNSAISENSKVDQVELFKNVSTLHADYSIKITGPKNPTEADLKSVYSEFYRILKAISETYNSKEQM